MDLLTAVMHEFGHVLGRDHERDGVMEETLITGTREAPELAHGHGLPAGKPAAPIAKAAPKAGWILSSRYRR